MPEAIGLIGLADVGAEAAIGADAIFGAEAAGAAGAEAFAGADIAAGAIGGAEAAGAAGAEIAAGTGADIGAAAEAGGFAGEFPGVEIGDVFGTGTAQFGTGFPGEVPAVAGGPPVSAAGGFAQPTAILGDPLTGATSPIGGALDPTGTLAGNESSLALSPGTTPTNVPGTVLQGASLDAGEVSPFSFGQGLNAPEGNFSFGQNFAPSTGAVPGVSFGPGPDFVPMPGEDFLTSSGPMSQFEIGSTGQILDPSGISSNVPMQQINADLSQQIPDWNSEILQQQTLQEAFGPQQEAFASPPGNELGPDIGRNFGSTPTTGDFQGGSVLTEPAQSVLSGAVPQNAGIFESVPMGPDIPSETTPLDIPTTGADPGLPVDPFSGAPIPQNIPGEGFNTPPVMGAGLSGIEPGMEILPSGEQLAGLPPQSSWFGLDPMSVPNATVGLDPAQLPSSGAVDIAGGGGGTAGAGGGGGNGFNVTKASSGAFGMSPMQMLGLGGLAGSLLFGNQGSPFGNTLGNVSSAQVQQAQQVLNTALAGQLNPSQFDAFNQAFAQGKARLDQQFRAMGRDPNADSSYIGALDNLREQLRASFIQQATTQALQELSVADTALANAARFQIAQDAAFRAALQGAVGAGARLFSGSGSTST